MSSEETKSTGFSLAIIGAIVIGLIVLIVTLNFKSSTDALNNITPAATAEYGRHILRETAAVLGPDQDDPDMRYSGTHLACASCHLDTGTKPGTLSLLGAAAKYPRFSGRDGKDSDLIDRINGCMQRSMNGQPLPRESIEMIAMQNYIISLGEQFAVMGSSSLELDEPERFSEPDRKASIETGQAIYQERCQICHGDDGEGLQASTDINEGYLFPPLWGDDSFNNGAGMTRILTASRFIKARMPLGNPTLSDDEAYDVAAYMNSHERPIKPNLEVDFPVLTRKPVDSPYLPYADPFSQEQHKLGPFAPIREYYEQLEDE